MGKTGDKGGKLSLDDLPDLLGEGMPELKFHALGRVRLINALRNRFGDGYRSVPGISALLGEFDKESQIELTHHKLRQRWGRK